MFATYIFKNQAIDLEKYQLIKSLSNKGSPNDRFTGFDSCVIDSPLQKFVHYKSF